MFTSRSMRFIVFIAVVTITFSMLLCGCSNKLIPRELKDYASEELNTPRRNVDVTQPYRTTFVLRIPDVNINDAYRMTEDFINCIADYARRDGVGDWLNDSLMFHVRRDSDADVNLKWTTSADNMRAFVSKKIDVMELIESCEKVESW